MDPTLEDVKAGGKAVSTLGWVHVVLGLLAIIFPFAAGAGVTVALGILLLLGGVGGLLDGWKRRDHGGLAPVVLGVLTALAGLLFLFRPWFGMQLLTMMLIVYFVLSGIVQLQVAFRLRPRRGWGWVAFDGALSLVLGIWLWTAFPEPALWLLGLLLGMRLLFMGIVMIATGRTVQEVADAAGGADA